MTAPGERARHWDQVYGRSEPEEVSWYQSTPSPSLALIERGAPPPDASVLDVGGGVSVLAGALLDRGYRRVGVLDVSAKAIETARLRLGHLAEKVEWMNGDVTTFRHTTPWDVWHDRAVLHFLTGEEERTAYRRRVLESVRPGGCVVVGVFGPEGPERCSGLPCRRYSLTEIETLLGPGFEVEEHLLHMHSTPGGAEQQFLYARLRRPGHPALTGSG